MAVQDLVLMDAKRVDIVAVEARIEEFTAVMIDMYNLPLRVIEYSDGHRRW